MTNIPKMIFLSALKLGMLATLLTWCLPAIADQPNVLFIVIDDLNDWVGPLGGHPQVQTPAIDALAKRGTTFTNAYCQSPFCNPSRTSFLLSRRPSSTGVYALNTSFRDAPSTRDATTVLQHFSKNGYETYCVGKIFHDGYRLMKTGQYAAEVDHFAPPQSPNPSPARKISGEHPIDGKIVDWGEFDHDMTQRCDWKSADWTIEHLNNRARDKPFFMACGFYLPHVPIYTTKKWHDLYPLESLRLPNIRNDDRDDCSPFAYYFTYRDPYPTTAWLLENNQLDKLVQSYLAAISFTDSQVGRVLEALEQTNQSDNTLVVLFSDHGFHCGEKGLSGKHTLWEESTRVPLLFAGPGVSKGLRCGEAVELLDVYPTLADLCELTIPNEVEGISLTSQLTDINARRERPAICTSSPGSHSVRDERWRLIQYADGSRELYDCLADPDEFDNLIHDASLRDEIANLEKSLPVTNAEPVPGSYQKMVSRRADGWYYENTRIEPQTTDGNQP